MERAASNICLKFKELGAIITAPSTYAGGHTYEKAGFRLSFVLLNRALYLGRKKELVSWGQKPPQTTRGSFQVGPCSSSIAKFHAHTISVLLL